MRRGRRPWDAGFLRPPPTSFASEHLVHQVNPQEEIDPVWRSPGKMPVFPPEWILTIVLSVVPWGPSLSDVPDAQREEAAHLLEFLRSTNCAVERNGKSHDGENAYSHVQKKYDYF